MASFKLIVVESPAKSKTIKQYLGNGYEVTASNGHVRELPSKDGSVVPENDFEMKYQVKAEAKKNIDRIVSLASKSSEVLLASDPDREGEAIAWHVSTILKNKKAISVDKLKRISFNQITKESVKKAIAEPRDIDMNLVMAQESRSALDYLVGFNLSPVLWRKLPGSKSAGRVQSVALRLICEREMEIKSFVSMPYWTIAIMGQTGEKKKVQISVTHFNGDAFSKTFPTSKEEAEDINKYINGLTFLIVDNVEKKEYRQNPLPPFTTATLQQEASRKLGFNSTRTMQIAQKLYEGVEIGTGISGLITYMRTDGTTIANEALTSIRKYIAENFAADYLPSKAAIYKTKVRNAQEAHEAIRPSDIFITPNSVKMHLSSEQYKLYDLIWKRALACQLAAAQKESTKVFFKDENGKVKGLLSGIRIIFEGFLTVYNNRNDLEKDEEEEQSLQEVFNKGDKINILESAVSEHFTQPPFRYGEGSLIKKMEELGIGRPSTYASIISILQKRLYVTLTKRQFHAEPLGMIVTEFLKKFFPRYVDYTFTAQVEEELDEIANGKIEKVKFLQLFWDSFISNVRQIKNKDLGDILVELDKSLKKFFLAKGMDDSCPSCSGGKIKLNIGKYGPYFACTTYPDCRFSQHIGGGDGISKEKMIAGNEEGDENAIVDDKGNVYKQKTGKFGAYIEVTTVAGEIKRRSLSGLPAPNGNDDIIKYGSLPRLVGVHPETKEEIRADIGRYGPYVLYKGSYYSIPKDELFTIGINRAVDIIVEKDNNPTAKKSSIIKLSHPVNKDVILVGKSRYGVYVKYKNKFYNLKDVDSPEEVTLEKAMEVMGNNKVQSKSVGVETKAKKVTKVTKKGAAESKVSVSPKKVTKRQKDK